jgi:hypothetical protein
MPLGNFFGFGVKSAIDRLSAAEAKRSVGWTTGTFYRSVGRLP